MADEKKGREVAERKQDEIRADL
jgi:hypothetical protein